MRVLFCCVVACALTFAVAGPAAAQAPAGLSKDQIYTEMTALAGHMQTLKANGQEGSTAYVEASARYEELSAYLGGERPGESGGNGNAAKSRARTKAVPTTPSSCGTATTTFTQSTPVAIPTGPAVVTSTLVVTGVDTYLFDLDATTVLTHTFAADLDITLTSPAGTVVTLSTDDGAGNDDVFNGTLWDDSANPGGQVPYTTNNGLATDHAYVNLTLASPLVPEEAMAAFIGEDPNGTWTITISDDAAGDGGKPRQLVARRHDAARPADHGHRTDRDSIHPGRHSDRPGGGDVHPRCCRRRHLDPRRQPDDLHHAHLPGGPRYHPDLSRRNGRDALDRQRGGQRRCLQRHGMGRQRQPGRTGAIHDQRRPGHRPRLYQSDPGFAARPRGGDGSLHRRGPERHLDHHHLRRPGGSTVGISPAGRSTSSPSAASRRTWRSPRPTALSTRRRAARRSTPSPRRTPVHPTPTRRAWSMRFRRRAPTSISRALLRAAPPATRRPVRAGSTTAPSACPPVRR